MNWSKNKQKPKKLSNNKRTNIMSRGKSYTKEEIRDMIAIFKQGASVEEISAMSGRPSSSITQKLRESGFSVINDMFAGEKNAETTQDGPILKVSDGEKTLVKQKTLEDFSPREMIKHLYNLGYRIKNNEIVMVIEKKIKLSDIING